MIGRRIYFYRRYIFTIVKISGVEMLYVRENKRYKNKRC